MIHWERKQMMAMVSLIVTSRVYDQILDRIGCQAMKKVRVLRLIRQVNCTRCYPLVGKKRTVRTKWLFYFKWIELITANLNAGTVCLIYAYSKAGRLLIFTYWPGKIAQLKEKRNNTRYQQLQLEISSSV